MINIFSKFIDKILNPIALAIHSRAIQYYNYKVNQILTRTENEYVNQDTYPDSKKRVEHSGRLAYKEPDSVLFRSNCDEPFRTKSEMIKLGKYDK